MDTKHFLPLGELGSERLLRSYSGGGGEEEEGEGIQKIEKSANSLRSCRLNPPPPAPGCAAPLLGESRGLFPPPPPLHPAADLVLFCALGLDLYYCYYYYYCVARRRKRYFQTGKPLVARSRCCGGGVGGGERLAARCLGCCFPLSVSLFIIFPPSLFLLSLVPFSTLFPAGVCHRFGAGVKSWLVKGECLPASGVQQKRYCRAQGSGRGKNKLLAKSPGAEPWEEELGPSPHRCHRAARPAGL